MDRCVGDKEHVAAIMNSTPLAPNGGVRPLPRARQRAVRPLRSVVPPLGPVFQITPLNNRRCSVAEVIEGPSMRPEFATEERRPTSTSQRGDMQDLAGAETRTKGESMTGLKRIEHCGDLNCDGKLRRKLAIRLETKERTLARQRARGIEAERRDVSAVRTTGKALDARWMRRRVRASNASTSTWARSMRQQAASMIRPSKTGGAPNISSYPQVFNPDSPKNPENLRRNGGMTLSAGEISGRTRTRIFYNRKRF